MTVNTATASASYSGNGSTASFPVPFYFLVDSDITVTRRTAAGVTSTWVLNSDYTLTGAGNVAGGTLTSAAPLPTGDEIYIERSVTAVQQTEYPVNSPFPAASHERALDRLTMLAQQTLNKLTFGLFRDPLTSSYNAGSNTIANVAAGVDDGDAVNKAQMEIAVAAAAGGVLPDTIARADYLASTDAGKGAALVGYKLADSGTGIVARNVMTRLREFPIRPEDFGGVGDGVTDDSAAIDACLAYSQTTGRTVDWGDETRIWRITNTLVLSLGTSGFRWVASGATIYFDPAAHKREAVQITVTGGYYKIDGKLIIDANRKANMAFYLSNSTDGSLSSYYGDFIATDLEVRNPYRDSTAFSGGDGIFIRGAWNRVILVRPAAINCAMAAGAGVPGSQGIFGITVSNNGGAAFRYCSIIDPYVDKVYSEDNTYKGDQDAIRVFDGGDSPSRLYPNETYFEIRGGEIRNPYGRGIKGQCNFGRVSGTKFFRDVGYSDGLAGRELDLQVGGCTIDGCEALYTGTVRPETFCQLSDTTVAGKLTPAVSVSNCKIVNVTGLSIPYVVICAKDQTVNTIANIDGVDVVGPCGRFIQWQVLGDGCALALSRVTAAPSNEFLLATQGVGAGTTTSRVLADRCVNTGASAINFVNRAGTGAVTIVSAASCVNFLPQLSFSNSNLAQPAVTRVAGIAADNDRNSGIFSPQSNATLADGATWVLPRVDRGNYSNLLLIVVGGGTGTSQAIIATSNNGAVKLQGTDWTAGVTSDPGSGLWRVWVDTATGGIAIKNASGTARSVMAYMFG